MATIFDILKQANPKYYGTPSPFDFLPSYAQDGENALAASAFRNRSEPLQSVPRERTDPWKDPLGHLSGMASDLGDIPASIAKDPVGSLAWTLGGIPPALGQMGQSLYDSAMAPVRAYRGELADPEASARELALNLAGIGGGRAVAKGLMAGAEAGPELGMFGGRLAKTADHAALAKAEAADAAGVPREDIWKQHGWFKGVDGKWRFEIDDSGLSAFLGSGRGIESGSVQHPQLAEAYNMDGLRTDISNGPQRGSFSPWTEREVKSGWPFQRTKTEVVNPGDLIASGPSEDIRKSVVAHELQHGVQFKEKFARGGSPKAFGSDEIAAERARLMAIKDDGWSSVSNFTGDTPDSQISHMLYNRLAGETEARAVQARMGLTPAERQAHPPWEKGPFGYDVPEDQQIVRFGDNGPAMSFGGDLPDGVKANWHPNSNGQINIDLMHGDENVGNAYVRSLGDSSQVGNININSEWRSKGIATHLYGEIEKRTGKPVVPDQTLSDSAMSFWEKHRPDAVKGKYNKSGSAWEQIREGQGVQAEKALPQNHTQLDALAEMFAPGGFFDK